MSSPSHDTILQSARRLFGERGYRGVTVRDIAADAGISAALVMKLFRSKEKLFAAAQPDESLLTDLDVPTSELGRALVFRVLMRRERGVQEPWAMIPFAIQDAPDPDAARAEIRERYLAAVARAMGDTSPDRRAAATVIALMTGFGETLRTLGLFDHWGFDELVAHFGPIIQAQIDAAPPPLGNPLSLNA
jgi:AcrR family transcriptional regulator